MSDRAILVTVKSNLFGSWRKTLGTVLSGIPLAVLAFLVARFIFVRANWAIITENQRLFFLGTYPIGQEWRAWLPLQIAVISGGLGYAASGASMRGLVRSLGVIAVLLLGLGFEFIPRWMNAFSVGLSLRPGVGWLLTAVALGLTAGSAFIGRRLLNSGVVSKRNTALASAALLVGAILLAIILQRNISPNRWNGYFLDVTVFSVGAVLSFPIGVLLAIARTSRIPSIRYSASAYIEIVRAGPLVVWLILALFLWNDFFFETSRVYRGMLVFGFFGAAYIAEVVRGGLQSIPKGQFEASSSLGLNLVQIYSYVILPQAIRAVTPALVGRFIALWKDTSLLIGLSLINTLEVSTAILEGNPANGRFLLEIYLVIALFYWIVSFSLSRLGAGAERSYGPH